MRYMSGKLGEVGMEAFGRSQEGNFVGMIVDRYVHLV